MIPLSWIFLSLLIGYLGRNGTLGFWGHFFVAFVLGPLLGALLVAVTGSAPGRSA